MNFMIFMFLKAFIVSEVYSFSNMIVIIIISTALAYVDLNAEPVSTCSQAGAWGQQLLSTVRFYTYDF